MNELYKDKDDNFYGYYKEGTEPTTQAYYDEVMARKKAEYEATNEYKLAEAKNYLADTDWMVTRQAEGIKQIPEEVKRKRQEAREWLSKNRGSLV